MTSLRTLFILILPLLTAFPVAAESPDADLEAMAARLRAADTGARTAADPPEMAPEPTAADEEAAPRPLRDDLLDFQALADRTHAWTADRSTAPAPLLTRRLIASKDRFNTLFPIAEETDFAPVAAPSAREEKPPCGTEPPGATNRQNRQ